ncbi:MAG: hypothetical protein RLZZ500_1025 [Bacteroidota bacterium]|jgi:uncharacterized membrane protein
MNDAHLHMVVNHFPIIGIILGFIVLVGGIILKNKTIQNTAYFLFIIAAIGTVASMATGEGAEEMVEELPEVGHKIIHEHEEIAEKFALLMYALGLVSLIGWFMNVKENAKAKWFTIIALVLSIAGVLLGKATGTSGGEIRHTEIRNEGNAASSSTMETHEDED